MRKTGKRNGEERLFSKPELRSSGWSSANSTFDSVLVSVNSGCCNIRYWGCALKRFVLPLCKL